MSEKEQQSPYPLVATNGHGGSTDAEAVAYANSARELRRKKRTRCLLYIVLFIIFQTGIITLFALTVMKIRTPKFVVREATIANFNGGTTANNSLMTSRLNVKFSLKNTNFGRYKYRNTTVVFMYRGARVGDAVVLSSRANWRSTKKFNVEVDLNLVSGQMVHDDLKAGIVPITCQAKLRGRVELMFVMKKIKSTDVNCSMIIVTETQQIRDIICI